MLATKDTTQKNTSAERASNVTSTPRPSSETTRTEPIHRGDGMSVPAHGDGIPTVHATSPDRKVPTRKPWKHAGANVKAQYGLTLQISFVLALALLLGLTFVSFETDDTYDVKLSEQDIVVMEEVAQTEQEIQAPPPPRPAAPIEVANDVVLEEQTLDFDASLDLNETLDVSGPPAPPEPEPEQEETYEEEIFVVVEDQPVLKGGLANLQQEVKYPQLAQKAGIEGRVFVQFVVNENGDVINPTVIRGRHPLLDAEALRVISQAKFEPGRQRGKAVKVQMAMPITFKLKNKR